MNKCNLVFLDLETTGINPHSDKIVEIGIVRIEKRKEIKSYSQLIKPPISIPLSAQLVHGISNEMVISKPKIKQIKHKIIELIKDAFIITHSANNFDILFLKKSLGENIVDLNKHINLCFLSRRLDSKYKSHKLESLAYRYKIELKNHHRALGDAYIAYGCFMNLCKQHKINLIEQVFSTLNHKMKDKKRLREIIKTRHREISLPYSEAKPSKVTDVYWVYAKRERGKYPKTTKRSGKWLVFVNCKNIDEVWEKIKKATKEGKLGNNAKVATSITNPYATEPHKKVICVYTYDSTDEKDVKRIRDELRRLGITDKIPYKTDEDTRNGKYRVRGDIRISKYYE